MLSDIYIGQKVDKAEYVYFSATLS